MVETEIESLLCRLIDAAAAGDQEALEEAASEVADRISCVRTFRDDGVLSSNRGLVIDTVEDRRTFQLQIVRRR
jgi:hypothetical protein